MDITARHQHQQRYWPFIESFDGLVLKHLSNVDLLWQKVDKYLKRTKKTQATSRLTSAFFFMLTLLNTFFGPKHNVVMDGDGESAKGIGAIYCHTTPISQQ